MRWHILDNVPFDTSFQGCIEKYDHPGPGVKYANTAFWYLSPDGVDPYKPVPAVDRDDYYTVPPVIINGMQLIEVTPGSAASQDMTDWKAGKWPNNVQMWWTGGQPGGKLKLRLPVKTDGIVSSGRFADEGPRLWDRAVLSGRQEAGRARR